MRNLLISILLTLGHFSFGQNNDCDCPKNNLTTTEKAVKIFKFSNGIEFGLCGYIEYDTIYSEFIIYQCGQSTFLNEWDATRSCVISLLNDTLSIQELYGLAIGNNLEIKWVPFHKTNYYFENSTLHTLSSFLTDLPKYSSSQIENVLKQHNQLTKKAGGDSILLVAHRLFWAYISGSKKAETFFKNFEKNFGPFDGHIAEEFHELWSTYKLYKL